MATLDPILFEMNGKVVADLLVQNMMALNQGQLIDAQAHRNRTAAITEASLVKGLELLYTVDPSEARGLRSLAQGEAVDTAGTGAILTAIIQQALKGAQTSRPETGGG